MPEANKPLCFVIQGFGEKTDFPTGRKLNLDASYRIIKEAVERAGLRCIRADEIQHSGTIDLPMYEHLMRADLVIADLSTYNVNAAFELGVRYGLRPYATIVVAETGLQNPFDVSHITISRYRHLGEDIGAAAAKDFQDTLVKLIGEVIGSKKTDSPVYTFLTKLSPPSEVNLLTSLAAAVGIARAPGLTADAASDASAGALLEKARAAMAKDDFATARDLLAAIRLIRPNDDYVRQQLALATYKSKQPTPEAALVEAQKILGELQPNDSNDPETLGLWGAVHKRLWDLKRGRKDLDASIDAYGRGYYLKSDYYNGINLAFVLSIRAAAQDKDGDKSRAIADFVEAQRVRAAVISICHKALEAGPRSEDDKYWILATAWEAALGTGDAAGAEQWRKLAEASAPKGWMLQTTTDQVAKLSALLANSPLRHIAQA